LSAPHKPDDLLALARQVGDDWKEGPYYDDAEARMQADWAAVIWPIIASSDFTCVVELAAGHGRNSEKLRHLTDHLYVVDINEENIDFLRQRFTKAQNITYIHNDGVTLDGLPDGEATLIYCFDAMVHFDSDVVRAYLREFNRILRRGGHCFCHYSNYTGDPTGSYRDHPGWRNFMSRELFEHYASKEGLSPLSSRLIREDVDAVTLLEKPRLPSLEHDETTERE
jgi:ubiquinone/menaquinone biosynthesis C-methylase UbiE